ncbi:unnamed protein product, partial [Discosporangium mesarthrocarpum]
SFTRLRERALNEYFGQPIVGYFYAGSLVSNDRISYPVDFNTVTKEELAQFSVPLRFTISKTSIMHGLGCWFDLTFSGRDSQVSLSTAPDRPGTHWYQCRLLLRDPIAVNATQVCGWFGGGS